MERSALVLFLVLGTAATASAIDFCKAFHPPHSQCVDECNTNAGFVEHETPSILCKNVSKVCCEPPPEQPDDPTPSTSKPPTDADTCGVKGGEEGGARRKRAIGGVVNPACSWPWLVSITIEADEIISKSHFITGVLVSTNAILVHKQTFNDITAPLMKLSKPTIVKAVMGEYYLNMVGDEKVVRDIDVSTAVTAGDFLILKLDEDVEVCECVRPICLENVTLELDKCMLAGWGDMGLTFQTYITNKGAASFPEKRTGDVTFAHIPLSVNAKVDMPSFCERIAAFAPDLEYTASTLCLNLPTSKMATENDRGSPIMCPDASGLWHLKGLLTEGNYNREGGTIPVPGPFGVDVIGSISEILDAIK